MNNNTNDIINSINDLNRAQAPAQFYAGVRAKMARQENAGTVNRQLSTVNSFSVNRQLSTVNSLKPAFITAVLFVFLITNIIVLSSGNKKTNITEAAKTSADLQGFADAYNLNSGGFAQ